MRIRGSITEGMWAMILTIVILILVAYIILPPSMGRAATFFVGDGEDRTGSISEKRFLEVNDANLGMFIEGSDASKPVLLFLSGGPGIPEYLLEYQYPTSLKDEFVVCYLDYRGTGLSYDKKIKAEELTTEQYLEDIVEVTNYLRQRFNTNKIYLMGHSFGSYLGLQVANQHPELYHAYIAMSQLTDQRQSEEMAYTYMKNQYQLYGKEKKVEAFSKYPILDSQEAYEAYVKSPLRDKAMHDLGIGTTREMRSVIKGIFLPSLKCLEYTPVERINIWKGKALVGGSPVAKDRMQFNAFEEVQELEVPIYFLAGRYDQTCHYDLQMKYYDAIKAPTKAFYTFNDSAHSPLFEEPDRAVEIMKRDVLNGMISMED